MCGIAGYIGQEECKATGLLKNLLFRLEYRGYDSWGVAVYSGSGFGYEKSVDPIELWEPRPFGAWGIAHTRWATHGAVTKRNAHPHFSCDDQIAVVHNGIITNYGELKERLGKKGHKFLSETDTEVIPHLIEDHMGLSLDLTSAFREAVNELEGTYAILATRNGFRVIYAAKRDSPLVIGRRGSMSGYAETFLSSDIVSLLPHCDHFVKLEDNDIAVVTEMGARVFANRKPAKRRVRKIENSGWAGLESKTTAGAYLTIQEINQQEDSIGCALEQDPDKIGRVVHGIKTAGKVILTGSGSAYNAALLGRYLFSDLGLMTISVPSHELPEYESAISEDTVIIPVSQSGETMDLISALKKVKGGNPKIYSIVNVPLSTLEDLSDTTLPVNCGPELGVAATKSFTGQQMVLLQLYYGLKGCKDYGKAVLEKTLGEVGSLLRKHRFSECVYGSCTRELQATPFFAILGAGPSYGIARELELKLDEWAEVPSHAYYPQEFKHGPLQLVQDYADRTHVFIAPQDRHLKETLEAVRKIKARNGRTIGITTENNTAVFDGALVIPEVEVPYPLAAIAAQLFAYNIADERRDLIANAKGIPRFVQTRTPWDRPDRLAKSLTVG